MLTLRDLKNKLNSLTDDQLDTNFTVLINDEYVQIVGYGDVISAEEDVITDDAIFLIALD